jgi:hypothetical protein
LKTYICNAPRAMLLKTLGHLSGMWWIMKTCFEEGKQYLGMGD